MEDVTAVVTGATGDLGAAVSRLFAREGAHVVVSARDADALAAVADEIATAGGSVTAHRADVRDEFDVERLFRVAVDHGPVDVVVAAASVSHDDPGGTRLVEESYAAFDDTMRTNVRGVYATVREAVPHLAPDARILVPSGTGVEQGTAGYGSYAVSKAAAEALVRGFAAELDQVVGVVDPGRVATTLTGGEGRDPAAAAEQFRWAAVEADPETVDGRVVDRRAWREATG